MDAEVHDVEIAMGCPFRASQSRVVVKRNPIERIKDDRSFGGDRGQRL